MKNTLKKLMAAILIFAMLVSLVSCGKKNQVSDSSDAEKGSTLADVSGAAETGGTAKDVFPSDEETERGSDGREDNDAQPSEAAEPKLLALASSEHYEDECRFVLENDAVIPYQGKQLHCFALPDEALAKIYQGNFDRFCGKTPCPVNKDATLEFISWSKSLISDSHIFGKLCREMDEVEFE